MTKRRRPPSSEPPVRASSEVREDDISLETADGAGEYIAGRDRLELLTREAIDRGTFATNRDVAIAAGMSPSAFAMCRTTGRHRPPARAISKLAAILTPPNEDETAIAANLALLFKHENEKIRQFRELRVVFLDYPPFSQRDIASASWDGFSVRVLDLIADMFDYAITPVDEGHAHTWGKALKLLQTGQADVASAVICPTARRRRRIDFSPPLPGLRLSVSAVMNRKVVKDIDDNIKDDRQKVTLDALHDKSTPWLKTLVPIVVEGEIGEEYANAFLGGLPRDRVVPLQQLSPGAIGDALRKVERGIALADSLTCSAVANSGSVVLLSGSDSSTALGSYPMCFGLSPRNPELKKLFNDAFDALQTEGLHALASIYRHYLRHENQEDFSLTKYYDRRRVTDAVLRRLLQFAKTEQQTR